jgi:hypothetical protein
MKTWMVLAGAALVIGAMASGQDRADGAGSMDKAYYKYMKVFRGHCYQAFKAEDITWQDAKVRCEAMGGHLVTVDCDEESKIVSSFASSGLGTRFWMGGTSESGKWLWVTNDMWRYQKWVKEEKTKENESDASTRKVSRKRDVDNQATKKTDEVVLNSRVGKYLYLLKDRWNARFADGGWDAEGDIRRDIAIDGFVCEWDDRKDIKFEDGYGFPDGVVKDKANSVGKKGGER